jgi:hypothetical protein
MLESVTKSVNNPLCKSSADAQSMSECRVYLLQGGVYWVSLTGWVERFPDARFIITTLSHYVKDPNSVLAEIADALGGVDVVRVDSLRMNAAARDESLAADVVEATAMLDK